jgi:hypothetical protein
MDEFKTRKEGKARRVSQRRELAVVTLAAVASISGVGGLLAASQHAGAPVQPASAPTTKGALTSPVHRPLALAPASYRSDDREEAGDDGGVVFRPANGVGTARHNGNTAHTPAPHARPSTVSRGSAPVN